MRCGCSRDVIVVVRLIPFCFSKGGYSSVSSMKIVVWFAAVTIPFILQTKNNLTCSSARYKKVPNSVL